MLISFTIATFTLLACGTLMVLQIRRYARWKKVSGTVIGISRDSSDGSGAIAPQVEFVTEARRKMVFTSSSYTGRGYTVGERIEVIYDPTDPSRSEVDDFLSKYFPFIIGIGLSVLLWAPITFMLFRTFRIGR